MKELKCPIHDTELAYLDEGVYGHTDCSMTGNKELWQELDRTRKALDYAANVIQTVAKMSDKLSKEYGETLVEQLDNIEAYCWQEGYILTHEEELNRAITKGGK